MPNTHYVPDVVLGAWAAEEARTGVCSQYTCLPTGNTADKSAALKWEIKVHAVTERT